MIYLSQILGNPVIDSSGERLGVVSDLGIATGEIFPRITSLAFTGPGKTPFMISWRKYVDQFSEDEVRLKVASADVRFSYLQPEEVLLARDILNKQIVDTGGLRVVRVNDLKLSDTDSSQLRLLGAEVGARGLLRSLSPKLEELVSKAARLVGKEIPENIIAWNYMDLLDRDLSDVKLSVTHKTLDELHPADIADIIEQLDPRLRGQVFAQLDDAQAALAMAELDDDEMAAEIVDDMEEREASRVLAEMDPDDAAELVSELDYEKAEKLLRLMGVKERRAVRQLLGYREDTAGRIMTSAFVALSPDTTVREAIAHVRQVSEDVETFHYLYLTDGQRKLKGVVSLHDLVLAKQTTPLIDIAATDVVTASPEDDQEDVAKDIAKYNLLAMPVVDDNGKLLGIVTVDDALDVLEEEHEEDLQMVGSRIGISSDEDGGLLARLLSSEMWFFFWIAASVILALIAGTSGWDVVGALAACVGMPLALRSAETMVRHVTSFFLEYDADDEEAPSLFNFAIRGIGAALVYALVSAILVRGSEGLLLDYAQRGPIDPGLAGQLLSRAAGGFFIGAGVAVLMFVLAPALLTVLRKREEAGRDTNGIVVRMCVMAIAAMVFVVLAALLVLRMAG